MTHDPHTIMRNLLPPQNPQEHRRLAYMVDKNKSAQAAIRRSIKVIRENLDRIQSTLTEQETNLANLELDLEHLVRILGESEHGGAGDAS